MFTERDILLRTWIAGLDAPHVSGGTDDQSLRNGETVYSHKDAPSAGPGRFYKGLQRRR